MKNTDFYTSDGWINTDTLFNDPATFIVCTGGRGIGKTFGVLREVLQRDMRFIYLRRTQSQIDTIKLAELNPFKAVNDVYGYDIVSAPLGKYMSGFYHSDEEGKPTGAAIGIGVALSTVSNIRGMSAEDFEIVVFDEFIPERHERPIKEEGTAFLNCMETFNRNREMAGRPPLKVILLSNSNDLDSEILRAIGALQPLDEMIRKRRNYVSLYDGELSIYRYLDSPISAKKAKSALYRVAHNEEFSTMALSNEFSASNYENVQPRNLKEYRPLVSIGNVTVYESKGDLDYYVVGGVKAEKVYTMLPNSQKAFVRRYWYLKEAMLTQRVFYATAPVKIDFEKVW